MIPPRHRHATVRARPWLSVVVPAYDEERVIETTLRALVQACEPLDRDFELIVVDDGSRDRTHALLTAAALDEPRLRVLGFAHNRGKGAAVRAGVLAARGRRIVCCDADLSTDVTHLEHFLAELDAGHALAIGNRRAHGACITVRQPWWRERLGAGFTSLARRMCARDIEDFTCGFKAFRAEAARELFQRVELCGWAFDAELLALARARGLSIVQIPVRWSHAQGSKVRVARDVLAALFDLTRIAWRRARGRYHTSATLTKSAANDRAGTNDLERRALGHTARERRAQHAHPAAVLAQRADNTRSNGTVTEHDLGCKTRMQDAQHERDAASRST